MASFVLIGCSTKRFEGPANAVEAGSPIKIFFVTNRDYQGGSNPETFFGNRPTTPKSRLRYGWHNLLPMKKGRLQAAQLKVQDRADWVEMIRSEVAVAEGGEAKTLMVFVHGYNNSFTEAAVTTAKLQRKFGRGAVAICYSWPSRDQLTSYVADQNEVESARGYFAKFLSELRADFPDQDIAVLAHSMGSQVAIEGMQKLPECKKVGLLNFGYAYSLKTLALLAADFDRDTYADDASRDVNLRAERVLIYVSNKDRALSASSRIRDVAGRLGQPLPTPYSDEKAETIDASDLEAGIVGHSYITDREEVLEDLHGAVMQGLEARRRKNLSPEPSVFSPKFWRLKEHRKS